MNQNKGASLRDRAATPSESSPAVSGKAGIPSAVTIPGELYAFLMGEGPLEGVWFGDMNEGFKGAFWWRALLRCAAGWPAIAMEGRQGRDGETRLDPKDDSAAIAQAQVPRGK